MFLLSRMHWTMNPPLTPPRRGTDRTGTNAWCLLPSLEGSGVGRTARLDRLRTGRCDRSRSCLGTFRAVTRHHPFAQNPVRSFHGVQVNGEFLLAGVLSDEFQAELKILESLRAQVSNRFGLLQCQ